MKHNFKIYSERMLVYFNAVAVKLYFYESSLSLVNFMLVSYFFDFISTWRLINAVKVSL